MCRTLEAQNPGMLESSKYHPMLQQPNQKKFWNFSQPQWCTLHENQCTSRVNASTILENQNSINKLENMKIFSGWNTKSQCNAKSRFNICTRIIQCSRISATNINSHFMNSRKNNFSSFLSTIPRSKLRKITREASLNSLQKFGQQGV